jgi:predicted lipoprotein with Yx(FWY)xxD motif
MRFAALCALFAYCAVGTAMAADAAPNPDHPGAVALARDNGTWVYQSFPAFLPLYVFDGDGLNQSNCDAVCAAVWPIIRAEAASKPTGDWTIVARPDGKRQWAYKGKPVYTFFLDRPGAPKGVGRLADWYLEEDADGKPLPGVKPKAKAPGVQPAWRLLEP